MNKNQLTAAIALTAVFLLGYFYYQFTIKETTPGENQYRFANQHLEDGEYEEALKVFDEVIEIYPDYKEAHLGKALTLMKMGLYDASLEAFNIALKLDENYGLAYANRGILNDMTGKYNEAVSDYRKAIEINEELAEGPGWLWRFLRNIPEAPSTIADRADYIETELKKPESERLLRVPEIDKQQRMYKK